MSDGSARRGAPGVPEIRTIFWDLGGVLLTNGWDPGQRAKVLRGLGVDLAAYELVHERENWFWERGLITAQEFFERTVVAPNPQLGITFEELWPLVCGESAVLHQGCFEILQALRDAAGVRLATLNNESRELNGYRLATFGLRESFDFFVCSGYVREMKPAPAIFRMAIELSGQPAETALFLDDKAENCDAARADGMQAIVFESPAQLEQELALRGVQVTSTSIR